MTSFCTIYVVWCTVSYCLYLFVCMCVFGAIDDPQFEEQQQDQDFGGPDQQQFEEGKWTLDHVLTHEITKTITFTFMFMHVSII